MSPDNRKIIKKFILVCITIFGLFTIIASGGGGSSSSSSDSSSDTTGNDQSDAAPPTVTISSPNNESSYNSGAYINFIGSAKDYEDNIISGANLVWTSSIDGRIGTGNMLELKQLSDGNHEITFRATDRFGSSASASISLSLQQQANTSPSVSISKPSDTETFNTGSLVLFEGYAEDAEDGILKDESLVWFSTIDGEIGNGETLTNTNLSGGSHKITLIAEDSQGLQATAESITISIENTRPTSEITWPEDSASYNQGDTITFNGEGSDYEDGDLYGSSLEWRSNIYGDFGTGRDLAISFLPSGSHEISLTVTDHEGAVDTDSISITVN